MTVADPNDDTRGEGVNYCRLGRDALIFLVGLGGIVHETLFAASERPTLLLLFGAMIGLPAFLRLDEKVKK